MIYNLKKITESLLDSVVEAGEIAKEISQRGVKITIKHDKSPVTDGDIEVDQILTSNIKKLTPDIPIISEETVDLRVAADSGEPLFSSNPGHKISKISTDIAKKASESFI